MNDPANPQSPILPQKPPSPFAKFWKKLDGSQKTNLTVLALVALTLPLGTAAALIEVHNRSQAYLPPTPISVPISPPTYPTPSPSPTTSPTSTPISCIRKIHTVTMTPSLQAGYAGSTLYYQAAVTNQDSSNCGGSYFTASSLLPHSSWWASFSPPTPFIAPGETKLITAGFTSATTNPPETVPVAIVMRGPYGTVHATSAYQVLGGPTPTPFPTPTITPPLPTPTTRPSPSPSTTPISTIRPTPSSTPIASTTPKPTATPNPTNINPVLLTRSLPTGRLNRSYSAILTAFDRNRDPLTFKVAGLPRGLRTFNCGAVKPNFFGLAQCSIAGQATTRGTFTVYVSVIDGKGGSATQKFQLTIR